MKKVSPEEFEKRLETILDMWDTSSVQQIGNKLGITKQRVCQHVFDLRKKGLNIPNKKTYNGFQEITQKILKKYKDKYK